MLATWSPSELAAPVSDPDLAFELGQVFDEDLTERLNARWDPRKVSEGYAGPVDLGWCGEDEGGVWSAVDPRAALMEMPELWDPVARWQGGLREMTERDWHELSAFEFDAKLVLALADNREQRRRMKQPRDEDDED